MLFWAGLRGAVGVALAAGITGDNADALRTTILVVVVLTVIIFGGTTARMLEVLGIRVGVEDEDASEDDDEAWSSQHGNLALAMGPGSRRFARQNGRGVYGDNDEIDLHSPVDSPYMSNLHLPSSRRSSGKPNARPTFGAPAMRSGFSTNSDESDEGEPLPPANQYSPGDFEAVAGDEDGGPKPGMIFRDGQWFTALDERYLLPLFSNSVTARRHLAKKAKKASVYNGQESGVGTPRAGQSIDINREEDYSADAESENGKKKMPRTFRWGRVVESVADDSGSVTDFFFAKADLPSGAQSPQPGGNGERDPRRGSAERGGGNGDGGRASR